MKLEDDLVILSFRIQLVKKDLADLYSLVDRMNLPQNLKYETIRTVLGQRVKEAERELDYLLKLLKEHDLYSEVEHAKST